METTASRMTIEHLGPDATNEDLRNFQQAVRHYQLREDATEQEATDVVFGDGDWMRNAHRLGLI